MAVFVLDKHKKPLMPCSEKRARLLLERGNKIQIEEGRSGAPSPGVNVGASGAA